MKKTVSVILVVISLFCLFTSSVSADDSTISRYSGYSRLYITEDERGHGGKLIDMVRNPYYQKYYNELLNYSCQVYYKLWKNTDNKNYIKQYSEKYLIDSENYCTLIFSAPEKEVYDSIADYNRSILVRFFDEKDILYVSEYDYAAVVCISADKADVVNSINELEFIGLPFFTNAPTTWMPAFSLHPMGDVGKSDVNSTDYGNVTAADARFLLRYVAGLETVGVNKLFYFCADVNFDNVINSADARLVLRTAAGLEEMSYIYYTYEQFWNDTLGVIDYEK